MAIRKPPCRDTAWILLSRATRSEMTGLIGLQAGGLALQISGPRLGR